MRNWIGAGVAMAVLLLAAPSFGAVATGPGAPQLSVISRTNETGASINLWRMGRVTTLLEATNRSVNIYTFGDSTAETGRSPLRILQDAMVGTYGCQEQGFNNDQDFVTVNVTASAGATWVNPDTGLFSLAPHAIIPSGGVVLFTNAYDVANGRMNISGVRVYYIANVGTNFTIQSDRGGSFANEATIIGSGTNGYVQLTNLVFNSGFIVNCGLKIIGTSGTATICLLGLQKSTLASRSFNKVRMANLGSGVLGFDTFLFGPTNSISSMWSNLAPDLVMCKMAHEYTYTGASYTNLQLFVSSITNVNPNCEILFVGPLTVPADNNAEAGRQALQAFCATNPCMYLDLTHYNLDTNWMFQSMMFDQNDNTHPNLYAYQFLMAPWLATWGLRPVNPFGSATFNRMFVGSYTPNFFNYDQDTPFIVTTPQSSGWFDVRPAPASTVLDLRNRQQRFLEQDGSANGSVSLFANNAGYVTLYSDQGGTIAAQFGPGLAGLLPRGVTTKANNGLALVTSNVVTSPYLLTNVWGSNIVVYLSMGTNTGIGVNGTLIGAMTNGLIQIDLQPGEWIGDTNSGGVPKVTMKPL